MSFKAVPVEPKKVPVKIVEALQHQSLDKYMRLFPTLDEFHQIMEFHQNAYGKNLGAAKDDFTRHYHDVLLPSLKVSFESLLKDGESKGIDWSVAQFVRVEIDEESSRTYDVVPLTLVIESKGNYYRIQFEKVLLIRGELRVSQFVKLV
jgi:hypothetical protein